MDFKWIDYANAYNRTHAKHTLTEERLTKKQNKKTMTMMKYCKNTKCWPYKHLLILCVWKYDGHISEVKNGNERNIGMYDEYFSTPINTQKYLQYIHGETKSQRD